MDDSTVTALAPIIRRAARRARSHPALTADDLTQIAWVAVLSSDTRGRLPDDPAHRDAWVAQRAAGAMLDAIQTEYRRALPDLSGEDVPDVAGCADPMRMLQMRQAVARWLAAAPERMRQVIDAGDDAAAVCGVTDSAVYQQRVRARALLARWL